MWCSLTTSTQLVNLMKIAEEEGIAKQVVESLQSALYWVDRPHYQRNARRVRAQSRFRTQPSENGPAGE